MSTALVSGPLRRQVLAALLNRPGVVCTGATLIEDLWGASAPRSAANTLRSHFRTDPASLVATACALAGADITHTQWQRYVGRRPYRSVCPRSN